MTKVTYGKTCANIFKQSTRTETFGVVLSESLKSFGITVIASYIDSQLACSLCSCFNCMRLIYNTSHKTATKLKLKLQCSSSVDINFCKEHRDKTEVPDPLAVEDLIRCKFNNKRKLARLITQYRDILHSTVQYSTGINISLYCVISFGNFWLFFFSDCRNHFSVALNFRRCTDSVKFPSSMSSQQTS